MTARLVTLGGSEIAAAAGIDPYTSPLMLSARKLGLVPKQPETEAMRLGKRLEPVIAELAMEAGYECIPAPAVTLHDPKRKWVTGHPDGYTAVDERQAVAELKCVGQAHRNWNGEPPVHYQAQAQWYMHLTGLPACVFFVLVGGQRFQVYDVARDDDAIAALLACGEAFVKLIRRGKLADADSSASSRAAVLELFPGATEKKVYRLTRDEWQAAKELRALKEQADAVAAQIRHRENVLKLAMGDAERAISPHDTDAIRWTNVRSSRVDTTALKAGHPALAEEFTKVTTTRRFTLL